METTFDERTMSSTTSLIEAGETHLPIPDTYGLAWVEWNTGDPVIVWTEPLGFHLERAGLDKGHDTSHLPESAESWLSGHLNTLYGAGRFTVSVSWSDWEDDRGPVLEVTVGMESKLDPQTPVPTAYGALWPAIATLFNVTDPGTYNSPYLFTTLLTEK